MKHNDTAVSPTHNIGNVYNLIWMLATITMTVIMVQATIANNYQPASEPIQWGALVCAVMFIFMPRGL